MIVLPRFNPVAFEIGPVQARWYGMAYALGFVAAWWLGRRRAKASWVPMTPKQVDDLITWLIVGLVVGARLGYSLFYDFGNLMERPWNVFAIWQGGMSFHGGAFGVFLAVFFFARRINQPVLAVGDFIVPLAPPGLLAGRMGNFINGELWGRTSDLPWAMVFPDDPTGLPRHPSQLYEAGLEGLVLFVILWIYSSKPRPTGSVTGMFLIFYGLFRFSVEFARQPDPQLGFLALGWLTMGQILSIPMIIIGLWLLLRSRKRQPETGAN